MLACIASWLSLFRQLLRAQAGMFALLCPTEWKEKESKRKRKRIKYLSFEKATFVIV